MVGLGEQERDSGDDVVFISNNYFEKLKQALVPLTPESRDLGESTPRTAHTFLSACAS